ncbi:MAG: nitrate reductase subunit alpha [Anaerolineae bacterium CFX3]|nr:nitrate reductase subunit alpha [Anaerolineae bacterium]MCE7904520.1 nitrate reductase subunit alpha [Anaerolineae bacterium CFX3]MCQ3945550.1 nitrate reductase subunit alpha [Anaerolineae bacterium]MCZ2288689.1 nitrate reductase subunit alpha [Anaerolineales bacterium]RIK27292.1 MAG: nitrate reductase subunit alpha [Anaerolineae bacterium]
MNWIEEIANPQARQWEEFYRNRWQHDRVIRSTHGVNCTGSCSWYIYVKDGIVTWELQALDYPSLEPGLPPYEPRGCQRGISFSWYQYSPVRVKYPYMRGALMDLWRKAKETHADPVEAWASIMDDSAARRSFQQARGKGGFRRVTWDETLEIIAASTIYTIKKYGPDRVIGFSPIPAMSMLSYAGGSRLMQLLGAVSMSFYDWYSDLPPASPEVWGEQTDVAESADWYNSKFIASVGSNMSMTRTPDVHFAAEARHNGTKLVVFAPDFSQVAKYADWWVPVNAGQDGAFWMAVNHVIMNEFHYKNPTPYFLDYMRRYTDAPFLVTLNEVDGKYVPGQMLRAAQVERTKDVENGDWKFLVWDEISAAPRMPQGALGFRWQEKKGQWNLESKDGLDGSEIRPQLTLLGATDERLSVSFAEFGEAKSFQRDVPVHYIETAQGKVAVATIYDILMAQFGVGRGLAGDYPADYDDENLSYTPAWQERYTGIDRQTVIQFAREWATTALKTEGKCMVIIGAGANHWYHNNLIYRACISTLMMTGCVGRNGGGLNHYVGQEKLAPMAPWATLAFALDWAKPPRQMNSPSFHYVNSDQWRYERTFTERQPVPRPEGEQHREMAQEHTIDAQIRAVRMGWLPSYPQFNVNSLEIVKRAEQAGAKSDAEIKQWIVDRLKSGELKFAVEDPDAPENWPRLWFIWRSNALNASAKGQEYFFKHYLGTHHQVISDEVDRSAFREVTYRENAPEGKFDLIVDINFRMDTSALYSDIVLPTASWYEKDDLSTTDMHSFIHPFTMAVPPSWESKSDWDIFKILAERISELAQTHLPEPVRDLVAMPLQHDTPAEIAQRHIRDWTLGECEPIPGVTMPNFVVAERDYVNLSKRFVSFGPKAQKEGLAIHGIHWDIADFYQQLLDSRPTVEWNGRRYPSLETARSAANVILHLAPETNGEAAYRAFQAEEERMGLKLTDLAEATRGSRVTFTDIVRQPRRLLNSPVWSGIVTDGRAYSAYCLNVERLVPWRTLTGRQHFYLDHEGYLAYGEHLPTYKPRPDPQEFGDLDKSQGEGKTLQLNYLTPHAKWHIHSNYFDNDRMLTLSRGIEPLWLSEQDARTLGVFDNDWVELYNDHGTTVTRAIVSARIPPGICIVYHAPERTVSVPKSPIRGNKRAGGHNSPTRIHLKPVLMAGGYGQFTYGFNYWGPTGVNRDTFVLVRKLPGKPEF